MDELTLARIFEPFFTTKDVGNWDRFGTVDRLRDREAARRLHRGR
jgi:signal transduction histidine kinase